MEEGVEREPEQHLDEPLLRLVKGEEHLQGSVFSLTQENILLSICRHELLLWSLLSLRGLARVH